MEASMQSLGFDPVALIADELAVSHDSVKATAELLDQGATVPFIARYRKEATGGLDEVQIRTIGERRDYLNELAQRKQTVLKSIEEQGKLTDELRSKILASLTKRDLEDLYLPYKPKRRTKATIAREKGLEPLAQRMLAQPLDGDPEGEALAFVDAEKGVKDKDEALKGAFDIVVEHIAEQAEIRAMVRSAFTEQGTLVTEKAVKEKTERTKFEDYYEYSEPITRVPSHRYLAICRGENEEVLKVRIQVEEEPLVEAILRQMGHNERSAYGPWMVKAAQEAFKRRIAPAAETDVRSDLKIRADRKAVEIFADNLKNLLLASPFGARPVIGIDPGLRTGSKCVAVDSTGGFVENITVYQARGEGQEQKAAQQILQMVRRHKPHAVAVGNGTGGRETEQMVRTAMKDAKEEVIVVQVNEAGASVYSASDTARKEFPDLDVSVRGAISIARRLQDPLAELVKIEPKSIGVGQYQHDVHQQLLERKLHEVVESCVNAVGVELNTASAELLAYVAGVGPTLAQKIVGYRGSRGAFEDRRSLLSVSGLGPKTFEQAGGFLRVRESKNPLDRSAVHPERYDLVDRMAHDLGVPISDLVGNAELAGRIRIESYTSDKVGEPTLRDIIDELKKPGRDPRASFEPPRFREDVNTLEDLKEGMVLEGVVTNVTAFGVFVDVGVHQDGLVHISELADRFVRDPSEVAKVGDRLTVRVLQVDLERRRISLSARSGQKGEERAQGKTGPTADGKARANHSDQRQLSSQGKGRRDDRKETRSKEKPQPRRQERFTHTPFADLLRKQ